MKNAFGWFLAGSAMTLCISFVIWLFVAFCAWNIFWPISFFGSIGEWGWLGRGAFATAILACVGAVVHEINTDHEVIGISQQVLWTHQYEHEKSHRTQQNEARVAEAETRHEKG